MTRILVLSVFLGAAVVVVVVVVVVLLLLLLLLVSSLSWCLLFYLTSCSSYA